MSRPTPGPWLHNPGHPTVWGQGKHYGCLAHTAPERKYTPRDIANARLIAAAPDLLEAAKEGAQVILELLQGKDPGELGLHEALVNLREAIVKAEGNE